MEDKPDCIYHLTFRRTFSATQRIGFELDHYDRHRITQEAAEDSLFIWRANLLGGGRLVEMSERFAALRNLDGSSTIRNGNSARDSLSATGGPRHPSFTRSPCCPRMG